MLIITADGSLTRRHPVHGECYHSRLGARTEARELYLEASGILTHFDRQPAITTVLDVGFGLAYTAMATIRAWQGAAEPGDLNLVSPEIDRELVAAAACGQGSWQRGWPADDLALVRRLSPETPDRWCARVDHANRKARLCWQIELGDIVETRAAWQEAAPARFDFIWHDPFSPKKNPSLWSAPFFACLAQAATRGAVLMTYSVASSVRRALSEAGWDWQKIPTPSSHKRHWLRALNARGPATIGY